MKNKTCGECKHFYDYENRCTPCVWCKPTDDACVGFEPQPITNGDRIRQMSNERLAGFISSRVECLGGVLGLADCPGNQMDCVKCWEIWLNAPADAPDTNVDTKESEVEDEP